MMACDASTSNPNPLLCESPAAEASSSMLAPGFRFHPTDEELVSYYLKRKVRGLPLRVDAIAEVDLYRREPWELPSLSRLRTGDREWYFFGTLDRKYAGRSRTNRATAKGYWKTTGKDRTVRHLSRVVGMKKTLVFHEGRAPHGKRTNWVMHEYRLEDDSLSPDIAQDSFVVCRLFEKTGSGPQNGAQYGAPFVEEEWEMAEALAPMSNPPLDALMPNYGEHDCVQSDDYEQKQVPRVHDDGTAVAVAKSEEKDIGGTHSEGPNFLLEEILDLDDYISEPGLYDNTNVVTNMRQSSGIQEQAHIPSDQDDGYMELNDFFDIVNVDSLCSDDLTEVDNDYIIKNSLNESTIVDKLGEGTPSDLIPNSQRENFYTPGDGDYTSIQLSEDNDVFAPNNETLYIESTNNLQFSPTDDVSGFDMVDELMAYFDATDNNFQSDGLYTIGNLECVSSAATARSDSIPEVGGSSRDSGKSILQVPGISTDRDAYFLDNKQLESRNEQYSVAPDTQPNDGWNTSLKKRVVDMLGSISAPPAMAEGSAKGKDVGPLSAAHSSSSIRVSAGMIRIHDTTVIRSAEHWTLQKNGATSFLLSYGIDSNSYVHGSVCLEPVSKLQGGGASTLLLRSGLYLFGLSLLILSVSFKVGMHVYNK